MMIYTAKCVYDGVPPELSWDSAAWDNTQVVHVDNFRPESSPMNRPEVAVRLAASHAGMHGIFQVKRERVRCVRTGYLAEVWKDSCVEFFVQPRLEAGYFNFEFNSGGALLCSYVTDPHRVEGGLASAAPLPCELGSTIKVASSLPSIVDPETEPMDWTLGFFIPLSVFIPYIGQVRVNPGERWKCNFYKCAEDVKYPHWASWAPVDELNFHLPRCFGDLVFA